MIKKKVKNTIVFKKNVSGKRYLQDKKKEDSQKISQNTKQLTDVILNPA